MKKPITLLCIFFLLISTTIISIPVKALEQTEHTLNITATEEGEIIASNPTYEVVNSASSGSTIFDSGTYFSLIHAYSSGEYYIGRGFLVFNTTGIPENANITSAILRLKAYNAPSPDFNITVQNTTSLNPHTPLIVSDYDQTFYAGNLGTANTSEIISNGDWFNITLNTEGLNYLNSTGETKFCLRCADDINGAYSSSNIVSFYDEATGQTVRPQLYITYTTPEIKSSNISVSDTVANKTVTFSSYWDSAPYDLSHYIFSSNNTGAWVNDTASAFASTPNWANVSKTLNSTLGQKIGYQWFVNDTANNWNSTSIQTLTTKGYTITASNDTYSLLDPVGVVTLCYGASQPFNFSALDGYTIQSVVINGTEYASTTSPYIFTDTQGNQTISVSTSSTVYYVNATSDSGCNVDPSGVQIIPAGTWANFTFSANIGYQLSALYVNGSQVSSGTTYNFIPTGNTTLYLTSMLIGSSSPGGSGSGNTYNTPLPSETATPPILSDVDPMQVFYTVVGVGGITAIVAITLGTPIFKKKVESGTW